MRQIWEGISESVAVFVCLSQAFEAKIMRKLSSDRKTAYLCNTKPTNIIL